ncbi:MAG: glycosyltransferase [Patescibacteria group bacterium]|jgi:glycosyltransferase involved in cell wall biosynthesis
MSLTLSVVIPTKNEEQYLPSILAELREQSLRPIEVIVSDANSTDATRVIAEKFGARVVDGGLPAIGRNRGAAVASGDLIYFFDADVILQDKDFLAHAVEEFERKTYDIASAFLGVIGGTLFDEFSHGCINEYFRLINSVRPHAPGCCILIRRSLHEAIGGFDETIVLAEDHDYALRASKCGVFGVLDSVKVFTSTRRQERDRRFFLIMKYLLAELHILFIGPIRHDKFKYEFGYDKKKV